jgi:hypothetical protein
MTHLEEHSLPYMDKALPDAWKAATTFASAISKETTQHGAVTPPKARSSRSASRSSMDVSSA